MKKGAIFDMDGLMFATEGLWQEGWRMLAKKYGYEPSADFGRDISGTSGEVMEGVVRKYYPGIDVKAFILEERAYVEDCLEKEVPIKWGLFEILRLFKANGVKMAVASSSQAAMIERNLKKTKTDRYFNVVLSSTQVAHAKPAPDVFLMAAQELSLPPEDCYVFEDSFGGVRAGAAAGCTTIMIPDQVQPTEEIRALADAVFESLAHAAEAIEEGRI
ncbi:MAG: HAD family phosphatase [Lachnospiraceae bacterium]|nr:HAD family phosphatase [Lachnospiraceae bacterium]